MNVNVSSKKRCYEKPTLSEVALRPDGLHTRCSTASMTSEPTSASSPCLVNDPRGSKASDPGQTHNGSLFDALRFDAQGK
jgi:hypothetical protein